MSSSPTNRLLAGLALTLAVVAGFSWFALRQIQGLRRLQTDIVERNRRDSLQLLRIQSDLHSLGLAMRDMVEGDQRYPLAAWKVEFSRTRADLEDALRLEATLAPASRTPEQQRHLSGSLERFWAACDRVFMLAQSGREQEARALIRGAL